MENTNKRLFIDERYPNDYIEEQQLYNEFMLEKLYSDYGNFDQYVNECCGKNGTLTEIKGGGAY